MVLRDRRGQSLVLFVLLLPILLGIMALVVDVGNVFLMKNKMDNTIEMVLDVVMEDHVSLPEAKVLLDKNLSHHQNQIISKDGEVVILSITNVEGIFSKLFGFHGFEVKSQYSGEVKDSRIVTYKKI